jgi:hypothetical protein
LDRHYPGAAGRGGGAASPRQPWDEGLTLKRTSYTAIVPGWTQRAVAVAILCVFAGIPVAATACEALCLASESVTATAGAAPVESESVHHHHHEATHPDPLAVSVAGSQLAPSGAHDCSAPDDAIPKGETPAVAWRIDARAGTTQLLSTGPHAPMVVGLHSVMSRRAWEGQRLPDAASSPASPPLVLRV